MIRSNEHLSTILPSSRLLLLRTTPPRILTGREALAVQGIGLEHTLGVDMSDADFMQLAGDAFTGALAMVTFIASLACHRIGQCEGE